MNIRKYGIFSTMILAAALTVAGCGTSSNGIHEASPVTPPTTEAPTADPTAEPTEEPTQASNIIDLSKCCVEDEYTVTKAGTYDVINAGTKTLNIDVPDGGEVVLNLKSISLTLPITDDNYYKQPFYGINARNCGRLTLNLIGESTIEAEDHRTETTPPNQPDFEKTYIAVNANAPVEIKGDGTLSLNNFLDGIRAAKSLNVTGGSLNITADPDELWSTGLYFCEDSVFSGGNCIINTAYGAVAESCRMTVSGGKYIFEGSDYGDMSSPLMLLANAAIDITGGTVQCSSFDALINPAVTNTSLNIEGGELILLTDRDDQLMEIMEKINCGSSIVSAGFIGAPAIPIPRDYKFELMFGSRSISKFSNKYAQKCVQYFGKLPDGAVPGNEALILNGIATEYSTHVF